MASRSDSARGYEGDIRQRNELRREAQLALLDVEAEAAGLRQLDLGTAYEKFFAHEMTPHADRWNQPMTCMMTALSRMGVERRVEEVIAPEINRRWEEIVEAGTWAEWLGQSDAEPASLQVWTPELPRRRGDRVKRSRLDRALRDGR